MTEKKLLAVAALLKKVGADALVVFDEPTIRFFCGMDVSDNAMVITDGEAVLIADNRYIGDAEKLKGVRTVLNDGGLFPLLERLFSEAGVKTVAVNESKLTFSQYEKLSAVCEIKKAASELFAVRAFKEGADLEAIKKAQSITDAAYKHILPYFKEGVTENEIVSEMIYFMRKQGAAEAFDTIVLFGPKTAVPHGVPGDVKLQKDVPVLLDFGAKYAGFCSDMSRSFYFGRPTEEYAAAWKTVFEAQAAALAGIKAGMTGRDCDALARGVIEKSRFAGTFTHSLGHGVGVEIHEWPNFAPRFEGPIPEGSVLSVEPGVYLAGRFGVRIEDIVHVEKNGVQNLTHSEKFSVL
jgi:Xaa-Pro aminopeptidase